MYVFFGGGVDLCDCDDDVLWGGLSLVEWVEWLEVSVFEVFGLVCVVVCELFEECGVLLVGLLGGDVVCDFGDVLWEIDWLVLFDCLFVFFELFECCGL